MTQFTLGIAFPINHLLMNPFLRMCFREAKLRHSCNYNVRVILVITKIACLETSAIAKELCKVKPRNCLCRVTEQKSTKQAGTSPWPSENYLQITAL